MRTTKLSPAVAAYLRRGEELYSRMQESTSQSKGSLQRMCMSEDEKMRLYETLEPTSTQLQSVLSEIHFEDEVAVRASVARLEEENCRLKQLADRLRLQLALKERELSTSHKICREMLPEVREICAVPIFSSKEFETALGPLLAISNKAQRPLATQQVCEKLHAYCGSCVASMMESQAALTLQMEQLNLKLNLQQVEHARAVKSAMDAVEKTGKEYQAEIKRLKELLYEADKDGAVKAARIVALEKKVEHQEQDLALSDRMNALQNSTAKSRDNARRQQRERLSDACEAEEELLRQFNADVEDKLASISLEKVKIKNTQSIVREAIQDKERRRVVISQQLEVVADELRRLRALYDTPE